MTFQELFLFYFYCIFTYYFTISLIITSSSMVNYFFVLRGSYLYLQLWNNLTFRFLNEYEELHVNTSKRRIRKTGKQNPPIPHNIDFVRGSAYGIFSRAFVEFLLTDVKARDLLQWARRTYTPDEFYWATLHHTYRNPHLHTPGAYSGERLSLDDWFTCRKANFIIYVVKLA